MGDLVFWNVVKEDLVVWDVVMGDFVQGKGDAIVPGPLI